MTTWNELVDELQARFVLTQEREDRIAITVSYETGRSQLVVIDRFQALDRLWISMRTRVCEAQRLAPREALEKNRAMVVGNLCIEEDHYVLQTRHLVPDLTLEEAAFTLRVLAKTADELEAALRTGADEF